MEKMGVPAIPMCTKAYTELANLTAAREGMPHLREVFTPHPVGGKSADELAAYLVNPDPVSGKQIMKEIVDDLTTPLTDDEKKTGMDSVAAGPATYGPETADGLQEIFLNNGMTDYMPIVIPTEEKVEAMLKGTSHSPDEVLQTPRQGVGYTSARWGYTVRQVAVNHMQIGTAHPASGDLDQDFAAGRLRDRPLAQNQRRLRPIQNHRAHG